MDVVKEYSVISISLYTVQPGTVDLIPGPNIIGQPLDGALAHSRGQPHMGRAANRRLILARIGWVREFITGNSFSSWDRRLGKGVL